MALYPSWWKKHFLIVELVWASVIACGLFAWAMFGSGAHVLTSIVSQNRGQLYGTVASISGSLLGFVITAMSIVLGFSSSDRLSILRNSDYYEQLWAVFTSTIRWLAGSTIIWILALLFERESHQRPLLLVSCISITLVASFRLMRCLWVLERIVEILTRKPPQKSDGTTNQGEKEVMGL